MSNPRQEAAKKELRKISPQGSCLQAAFEEFQTNSLGQRQIPAHCEGTPVRRVVCSTGILIVFSAG